MLKQLSLASAILSMFLLQSCDGYKKTETGLKYKIIADSTTGPNGEDGGYIIFNYIMKNSKDSMIVNTYTSGGPVPAPIGQSSFKGSLEEGFKLLSQGDSAQFFVSADSVFEKTFHRDLPKGVDKGTDLQFIIKVVKLYTKAEAEKELAKQKEMQQKMQEQAMVEEQNQTTADSTTLVDYLKKNNIKAKRTPNGVYYVVHKSSNGPTITAGEKISVHYKGTLLDGTKFDSSYDRGTPFELTVGTGQVIRGWDEGLAALKKGEKATLYIPSGMAYGPRGAGGAIPPNANLIFEVEILK
ncbi:MAG: FKBP-type peptidyl-prolyl cis-trans isomerase [Cytophagaceae bacterium]